MRFVGKIEEINDEEIIISLEDDNEQISVLTLYTKCIKNIDDYQVGRSVTIDDEGIFVHIPPVWDEKWNAEVEKQMEELFPHELFDEDK